MAKLFSACTALLLICATIFMLNSLSAVDASEDYQHHLGWVPSGSLAIDEEEEFELDSEINRRILATNNYISYGALQRNSVPCSRRGASYYNCQSGGQANPYKRDCSAITRCRRWFFFLINFGNGSHCYTWRRKTGDGYLLLYEKIFFCCNVIIIFWMSLLKDNSNYIFLPFFFLIFFSFNILSMVGFRFIPSLLIQNWQASFPGF